MKKIFTSDGCPNCIIAKDYIVKNNLDIEIVHIDPMTRAGRDIQMQYRIMGVPVLLELDGETEMSRQVGIIDFSKI